eukprot:1139524-Pelagomonas_calceolata.AAC.21
MQQHDLWALPKSAPVILEIRQHQESQLFNFCSTDGCKSILDQWKSYAPRARAYTHTPARSGCTRMHTSARSGCTNTHLHDLGVGKQEDKLLAFNTALHEYALQVLSPLMCTIPFGHLNLGLHPSLELGLLRDNTMLMFVTGKQVSSTKPLKMNSKQQQKLATKDPHNKYNKAASSTGDC